MSEQTDAVIYHINNAITYASDLQQKADQSFAAIFAELQHAADVARGMDVDQKPDDVIVLPSKSKGIDVSHYQGTIDWQKVKASGVVFAFIKATEGTSLTDNLFLHNWQTAKAIGIPRGAYHFYRFAADPIAQANFFVSLINNDLGELSPVVDVEEDISPVDVSKTIKVFCERVFELTGRRCMIYTGAWWWTTKRLGGPQPWAKEYPLWIAAYVSPPPRIPDDWSAWSFWQYSNKGSINGISAAVDLDMSA